MKWTFLILLSLACSAAPSDATDTDVDTESETAACDDPLTGSEYADLLPKLLCDYVETCPGHEADDLCEQYVRSAVLSEECFNGCMARTCVSFLQDPEECQTFEIEHMPKECDSNNHCGS